jgi:hypothetical protein
MQTVSRYLLTNSVIVYQNGYHGRNSKVYDRRLKIYRGVRNPITFTFKNEDQKKQDITGKTYQFNIIDTESKKAVVTRYLSILDDGSTTSSKGTASVEITDADLLDLDNKFYEYSINEVKTDGSTLVTFADTSYVSSGTIELLDGAYPQFQPSQTITSFTVTSGPLAKTSGAIDAYPGKNNNSALHTAAIYTTGFAGRVKIQGTMVTTSPVDADYFDIANVDITASDSVVYQNFNGVYQNIRFSYGRNSGNTGTLDKILYRH